MILSLITNKPLFAANAQSCGVDRIMIDLERKGKVDRQQGLDLFISDHKMEDISSLRRVLKRSELMVRINSMDEASHDEIDEVIARGADLIMLPYFSDAAEVEAFLSILRKRAKVVLLVETASAVENLSGILKQDGIDEIHIGLNDLSLSMNSRSIFEPVCDGTIETVCAQIKKTGKPYGFGGIGRLTATGLPVKPERVLAEQIRMGCTRGWLGRSFRNDMEDQESMQELSLEIQMLRTVITYWKKAGNNEFTASQMKFREEVNLWHQQRALHGNQH